MLSRLTSTLSEVKLRSDVVISLDQPVEDDFQHRQALIGDQRRIDDRLNARFVLGFAFSPTSKPRRLNDLVLVEDALRSGRNRGIAFR